MKRIESLYAEMSILAVNAASKNAEVATRFVEFCAENLSNTVRYEMEPELNEPVESSAYYVRVAELQGKINDLAEQLEKADQDARYEIKEKIIQAEAKLEQLEERKWEIDPKSIEIYRSAAENLKVSYKSPLLLKGENGGYEALRSVVDKYCTQDFCIQSISGTAACGLPDRSSAYQTAQSACCLNMRYCASSPSRCLPRKAA